MLAGKIMLERGGWQVRKLQTGIFAVLKPCGLIAAWDIADLSSAIQELDRLRAAAEPRQLQLAGLVDQEGLDL